MNIKSRAQRTQQVRAYVCIKYAPKVATHTMKNRVSVADALKAHKNGEGVFVDVRHPDQFNELTGVGFVNIPHFQFRYFAEEAKPFESLDKQEPIYLIDTWGYYSSLAAKALDRESFGDVNVIDGTSLLVFVLTSKRWFDDLVLSRRRACVELTRKTKSD